jgi:hypothetical protein
MKGLPSPRFSGDQCFFASGMKMKPPTLVMT